MTRDYRLLEDFDLIFEDNGQVNPNNVLFEAGSPDTEEETADDDAVSDKDKEAAAKKENKNSAELIKTVLLGAFNSSKELDADFFKYSLMNGAAPTSEVDVNGTKYKIIFTDKIKDTKYAEVDSKKNELKANLKPFVLAKIKKPHFAVVDGHLTEPDEAFSEFKAAVVDAIKSLSRKVANGSTADGDAEKRKQSAEKAAKTRAMKKAQQQPNQDKSVDQGTEQGGDDIQDKNKTQDQDPNQDKDQGTDQNGTGQGKGQETDPNGDKKANGQGNDPNGDEKVNGQDQAGSNTNNNPKPQETEVQPKVEPNDKNDPAVPKDADEIVADLIRKYKRNYEPRVESDVEQNPDFTQDDIEQLASDYTDRIIDKYGNDDSDDVREPLEKYIQYDISRKLQSKNRRNPAKNPDDDDPNKDNGFLDGTDDKDGKDKDSKDTEKETDEQKKAREDAEYQKEHPVKSRLNKLDNYINRQVQTANTLGQTFGW